MPDTSDEIEVSRVDRVEIEFAQGEHRAVVETTGPYRLHVQVPSSLRSGAVTVRNRTWIDQTASAWSAPVRYRLPSRPASTRIRGIRVGPHQVWWTGSDGPRFISAEPGAAFELDGDFPAGADAVYAQLERGRTTQALKTSTTTEGLRIELPPDIDIGVWHLRVGDRHGSQRLTLVRVQ